MPDIGETLRETRTRQGIDIADVELETKIRAKYLRALENEEWSLLPGPTYVKSFLRSYAHALGLDGKLLVEEYKLRHERLSDVETQPIAPPGQRDRRPPAPRIPRGVVIAVLVLALVGSLYLLGARGGDDERAASTTRTATTSTRTATTVRPRTTTSAAAPQRPARPRRVRLALVPSAPVYVCLRAASRTLLAGETIAETTRTFRARRFAMTLGNGSVDLRVNGRRIDVPESAEPIGLEVTRSGRRRTLSEARRPTCGA